MKIKNDFMLRKVADQWVVLPLGEQTVNFNAMMTLNDAGALLWQALEQGCDIDALVGVLTSEYKVSEAQARNDAMDFVKKLNDIGCLDC